MATFRRFLQVLLILSHASGILSRRLFETGKEYKYSYFGLFTTGTEAPVSYASSYMVIGLLRVQGNNDNSVTAKLEGMKVAIHNGRWQYFPIPQFDFLDDERLKMVEEPFKIDFTEDGKFKMLTMNDQEPEFASNMKRGLATYLQLNLTGVGDLQSIDLFKNHEMTTLGECPTSYEVTPSTPSSPFARVGKYRNHADCPDIPRRTRYGTKAYYPCPVDNTRDLFNSTSYSTYDLSLDNNATTLNKVTVFSSILYWPFTSGPGRQYLYTWFNVTLALLDARPFTTQIPDPENAETHEDLTYVFEQSDYLDPEEETPDVKTVEPFYFHQPLHEVDDSDNTEALVSKAKELMESAAENYNKSIDDLGESFHTNSQINLSSILSYLDYDSLLLLYKYYSSENQTDPGKALKTQLYVDGLVMAGTSSTVLVIRDIILQESENWHMLMRILPVFPHHIRTPSEQIVKEFETVFELLKTTKIPKHVKMTLELSLSTLVSRGCERNLCTTTGILDKYITYFEKKLEGSTFFGDQSSAVLGLRNLQIGKSLEKLKDIALGDVVMSNMVRVQAIWSLRPWFNQDKEETTRALLRVFYNRTESCEIRTNVFSLIVTANLDKQILHKIAYFMWSETCPQTLNLVRSTLAHMAKATGPCSRTATYARTIVQYLPPGTVDKTRTGSYDIEYFDQVNGFGKSFHITEQRVGHTALPVTIYVGTSHTIGGFASSPFGIFIRMEGLEKFIPDNMLTDMDPRTAENILRILSDLKVSKKLRTPLRLEYVLMYLGKVVAYHAADEETLRISVGKGMRDFESFVRTLANKNSTFSGLWTRSSLITETLYEQPLEVGIPVSIYTTGTVNVGINAKISLESKGPHMNNLDLEAQIKSDIFARTSISNHFPLLGTVHSVGLLRTLRMSRPQHFSAAWDTTPYKPDVVTFHVPSPENPFTVQTHAAAFTSVSSESPTTNDSTTLLHKSCSSCSPWTFVTSGKRDTTEDIWTPSLIQGTRVGIKKVRCEKRISKSILIQKIKDFFGPEGKNTGIFDTTLSKVLLASQKAYDYLFYWPNAEPCGFQLYASKNFPNSSHILQKIETSSSFTFTPKSETVAFENNATFKYEGDGRPPPKQVSFYAQVVHEEGSQEWHFKYTANDQENGKVFVKCIDINNFASTPPTDPLGFEGANEPKVNQTILLTAGIGSDGCPHDLVDISISAFAHRSPEQIAEWAEAKDLPYALCHLEKQSGKWPANVLPPTNECLQVTLDQTGLRKAQLAVKYKITPEVRKELAKTLRLLGNLLSPYLTDPSSEDKVHDEHKQEDDKQDEHEGEIEVDMNLKKEGPVMDIHFLDKVSTQDLHYHSIDLDLFPNAIKPKPAPSRIAQISQFFYNAGFMGTCALTPKHVATFDNLKYAADLPECETLIAADCGEWPNFAVYAKAKADKLSVRISSRGGEIAINGNDVTFDNKGVVEFDAKGVFRHGEISVTKKGSEIIMKRAFLGPEVRFSGGDFIQITVGSRYRGQVCGLCGNFDSYSSNDVRGPSTPSCSLTQIINAWTLKSGSCGTVQAVC